MKFALSTIGGDLVLRLIYDWISVIVQFCDVFFFCVNKLQNGLLEVRQAFLRLCHVTTNVSDEDLSIHYRIYSVVWRISILLRCNWTLFISDYTWQDNNIKC